VVIISHIDRFGQRLLSNYSKFFSFSAFPQSVLPLCRQALLVYAPLLSENLKTIFFDNRGSDLFYVRVFLFFYSIRLFDFYFVYSIM
jgi:hypothetical protein